jgi:hypothetical protein
VSPDEHFLFPSRTTADTLLAVIRDWIEPGTKVISDCWAAYNNFGSQGYEHQTVNHSFHFKNPITGAHTHTIEATWRHVKVFLLHYHRGEDYHLHLAHYMFAARCRADGLAPFVMFLQLVANTDWSLCSLPSS